MYSLDRITDATVEPVSIAQAKSHCRVSGDEDNALFAAYLKAARMLCEEATGRAFLQQTWRLSRDHFPEWQMSGLNPVTLQAPHWSGYYLPPVLLPRTNLIGIVSVTYLDFSGTRQTLDPALYMTDADGSPASLSPAAACIWPAVLPTPGSVQVTYKAGFGTTADAVPAPLQLAILQLVAHWYENREATVLPESGAGPVSIPFGVDALLAPYVVELCTFES